MAPLTSSGVARGWSDVTTAATPAVRAVDIEVPLPRKYESPMRADGLATSMVEPGARSETVETPGATTSGFDRSGHDCEPDHGATVSSARVAVPCESDDPAVRTYGSRPGD